MKLRWHKEPGSFTLSPELKWSCREGQFENNQYSQNLLRRTIQFENHQNLFTDNWDVFLDDCMATINAIINRSSGETTFYALYKYDKRYL